MGVARSKRERYESAFVLQPQFYVSQSDAERSLSRTHQATRRRRDREGEKVCAVVVRKQNRPGNTKTRTLRWKRKKWIKRASSPDPPDCERQIELHTITASRHNVVLVCGSLDWTNRSVITEYMDEQFSSETEVITGGNIGAEQIATDIATARGLKVRRFPLSILREQYKVGPSGGEQTEIVTLDSLRLVHANLMVEQSGHVLAFIADDCDYPMAIVNVAIKRGVSYEMIGSRK
jgi:hypothetical protein